MATKAKSKASVTKILRTKTAVKAKSRANAIKATSVAKPAIARRSPGKSVSP